MKPAYRTCLNQLISYVPGKSIKEVSALNISGFPMIKMASNENPLGSAVSFDSLRSVYDTIHHYPHIPTMGLYEALSAYWGFSTDRFVLGNGSDEVILALTMAFLGVGETVITSAQTFSEYRFSTLVMDGRLVEVPLQSDFQIDLTGILNSITDQTKLIYIANPNNPTGRFLSQDELLDFLSQVPKSVIVVLDEAYAEFATHDDFPNTKALLCTYSNLVVLRTFSKAYGLAGLRLGYGVAHPEIIQALNKVLPPFHVNTLAIEAGRLALANTDFVKKSVSLVVNGRARLAELLSECGFNVLASEANFVFAYSSTSACDLYTYLLTQGIIIRALNSFGFPNAIRVTVGLPEHHQRLYTALKEFYETHPTV
jgi:histidinol-phosphate aminotransferase